MITARNYQEKDNQKVMVFLREMYKLNHNQHCLLPQRWEDNENWDPKEVEVWHKRIRIWEEDEKIVAVGNTDYGWAVYLNIHPNYYKLTDEMVEWAENIDWGDSKEVLTDGKRTVYIWSADSNIYRNEYLSDRKYIKPKTPVYQTLQYLDKEIASPKLTEEYTIRSMEDDIDILKRYEISEKIFIPVEEYVPNISESFYNRMKNPLYRKDLDIVTVYKDGSLTSCCILWYDEKTKTGMFEPVGTHPEHRMKGLAKAIILEAITRLKKLGATTVYVECFGDERKAFYSSVGFETYEKGYFWRKYFEE